MARSDTLLFADTDLRQALAARREQALSELAQYDPHKLLKRTSKTSLLT